MKEKFLEAAVALLEKIKPLASVLGLGGSVDKALSSSKDQLSSIKEAKAANEQRGSLTFEQAKATAGKALDFKDDITQGMIDEAKAKLKQGVSNIGSGVSKVGPLVMEAMSKVIDETQKSFQNADKIYSEEELANKRKAFLDVYKQLVPEKKAGKAIVSTNDSFVLDKGQKDSSSKAEKATTGKIPSSSEVNVVADSMQSIGGGGNFAASQILPPIDNLTLEGKTTATIGGIQGEAGRGGDSAVVSELVKHTNLLERLVELMGTKGGVGGLTLARA
jgi:hypothetical protein